jgi:hypothetical protein
MKFTVFIMIAILASESAWAAKKLESYSAIEPSSIAPGVQAQLAGEVHPTSIAPPVPSKKPAPRVVKTALTIAPQKSPARRTSVTPVSRGNFDPVASDQIDSVAQRLKLVEQILVRHARAYDYRVHSARELRAILSRLDGKHQPGQAARSAPVPERPAAVADDSDLSKIPAATEDFEDADEPSEEL